MQRFFMKSVASIREWLLQKTTVFQSHSSENRFALKKALLQDVQSHHGSSKHVMGLHLLSGVQGCIL